MIIYLYGPDSYRLNQKLRELIKAYQKKRSEIDILSIDLEDNPEEWTKVRDFLKQPSIFVDSKVAIVKNISVVDKAEWIKTMKAQLQLPKTFLLLVDKKSPTQKFRFLLKEPVRYQFFPELEGRQLTLFLKNELLARKLSFSSSALHFFIDYLEDHQDRSWLLINELDKIRYAGFSQPISLDDLETLVPWAAKKNVFDLIGQFSSSTSIAKKLSILEKLFLQKEPPAYLFNLLAYRASPDQAIRLAEYDVAIKSGSSTYEEALLDFAIS